MSETSKDPGTVIGTAPTGSRETDGRSAAASPAEDGPLTAPERQGAPTRPDGGAASSMNQDVIRALSELRLARQAAEGHPGLGTSAGLTHDVELAEWRLNSLLERGHAATRRQRAR